MITRTMTKDVDHKGSIASDADCIASLVNERRVALHAPTGPSSLAINKNSVKDLEGCHASLKVTPPSGQNVTFRLLVIHAISGCDTTSCLLGQGKFSVFNKVS